MITKGVIPGTIQKKAFGHFFKVYAPSVSSPFSLVGDSEERMDDTPGGAIVAFGDRRIVWALLHATRSPGSNE